MKKTYKPIDLLRILVSAEKCDGLQYNQEDLRAELGWSSAAVSWTLAYYLRDDRIEEDDGYYTVTEKGTRFFSVYCMLVDRHQDILKKTSKE